MLIRKFDRESLESEPHKVLFKDLYPWEAIDETPFGASLAVVEPGGETMVHSHNPAETFIICQGQGTMTVNGQVVQVSSGDVIYMPPQSVHCLKNDSQAEPLMFLSVFWDAPPEEEETEVVPRLIVPSPPTSNGPLHLGHLAGPYLMADAFRRFSRMRGVPATLLCLTDDDQTYVVERARSDGAEVAETANRYADQTVATLKAFQAEPDAVVHPARDEEYRQAVSQAFERLPLETRQVEVLYCEQCARHLCDGFVIGLCPHCGSTSRGFACEVCCLPNRTVDLGEPECVACDSEPVVRTIEQRFFSLEPFKERLANWHAELRLTPKLRGLAARMLAMPELAVAATQPGDWGVPAPGVEGQVISPWLEVALAGNFLRKKLAPQSEVFHFFGYDNAFVYLVHDPAVSLATEPEADLPVGFGPNEYLLLDDSKMSTSGAHALDALEVLGQVPADLVRLYLATVRPEEGQTSCSMPAMAAFLNHQVIEKWQSWLARLAQSLTTEAGSRAPGPVDWSSEHSEFLGRLEALLAQATRGYESCSLQEVARAVHELVERAINFANSQSYLAGLPALLGQRATALALELAAVRLLALMTAPLMPGFSAQLWKCLGYREPAGWPSEVEFLEPGQRLLAAAGLGARRFFPASV